MFSKDLELSIASLFDKAHEANIQYITVEHLLLICLLYTSDAADEE